MESISLEAKRVVFFVAETPPSLSGSGIMAYRFAKYLSEHASGLKMVSFNYNRKLLPKEQQGKLEIRRISYFNKTLTSKLLSFPWLIIQYLRHSSKQNICFIYGSYMPGYETIILYNLIFGIRTIFVSTLLGDDDLETILKNSVFPLKVFRRWLFRRIYIYWAINKEFEKICREQLGNKPNVFLSSQGVDDELFYPVPAKKKTELRQASKYPKNTLIFLSVGFLIKRKGFTHIYKSLAKLDSPFIYIIAGAFSENINHRSTREEIEEMDYLYHLGKKLLGEKIIFTGATHSVHSLYSMADIIIHGADREGTPNVVLEAMACQKPVILKKLAGLDYFIRDEENALIYSDAQELNSGILRLTSDMKLAAKIAKNAYSEIQNRHTIESIAQKLFLINESPAKNSD